MSGIARCIGKIESHLYHCWCEWLFLFAFVISWLLFFYFILFLFVHMDFFFFQFLFVYVVCCVLRNNFLSNWFLLCRIYFCCCCWRCVLRIVRRSTNLLSQYWIFCRFCVLCCVDRREHTATRVRSNANRWSHQRARWAAATDAHRRAPRLASNTAPFSRKCRTCFLVPCRHSFSVLLPSSFHYCDHSFCFFSWRILITQILSLLLLLSLFLMKI